MMTLNTSNVQYRGKISKPHSAGRNGEDINMKTKKQNKIKSLGCSFMFNSKYVIE